ncbi:MAG: hypothetical protein ACK4NR_05410 [Micavibrio sp.]
MIEAVNSTIQNASLLRASAGQVSAAESFAANPARVQKVGRAPSMSIYVDINYDTAVLQFRNAETRDVIDQIPSETLLESRARDEARQVEVQRQAAQPKSEQATTVTSQATQGTVDKAPVPEVNVSAPSAAGSAPTPQQISAFTSAAQAGSPSSSSVSVLA